MSVLFRRLRLAWRFWNEGKFSPRSSWAAAGHAHGFRIYGKSGLWPAAAMPACHCGRGCEFPCWQRLGIAPVCKSCGCDR